MPIVRCKYYDNGGNPIGNGCPWQGISCNFVHPSEPAWNSAPPTNKHGAGQAGFGGSRGRGSAPAWGTEPSRGTPTLPKPLGRGGPSRGAPGDEIPAEPRGGNRGRGGSFGARKSSGNRGGGSLSVGSASANDIWNATPRFKEGITAGSDSASMAAESGADNSSWSNTSSNDKGKQKGDSGWGTTEAKETGTGGWGTSDAWGTGGGGGWGTADDAWGSGGGGWGASNDAWGDSSASTTGNVGGWGASSGTQAKAAASESATAQQRDTDADDAMDTGESAPSAPHTADNDILTSTPGVFRKDSRTNWSAPAPDSGWAAKDKGKGKETASTVVESTASQDIVMDPPTATVTSSVLPKAPRIQQERKRNPEKWARVAPARSPTLVSPAPPATARVPTQRTSSSARRTSRRIESQEDKLQLLVDAIQAFHDMKEAEQSYVFFMRIYDSKWFAFSSSSPSAGPTLEEDRAAVENARDRTQQDFEDCLNDLVKVASWTSAPAAGLEGLEMQEMVRYAEGLKGWVESTRSTETQLKQKFYDAVEAKAKMPPNSQTSGRATPKETLASLLSRIGVAEGALDTAADEMFNRFTTLGADMETLSQERLEKHQQARELEDGEEDNDDKSSAARLEREAHRLRQRLDEQKERTRNVRAMADQTNRSLETLANEGKELEKELDVRKQTLKELEADQNSNTALLNETSALLQRVLAGPAPATLDTSAIVKELTPRVQSAVSENVQPVLESLRHVYTSATQQAERDMSAQLQARLGSAMDMAERLDRVLSAAYL